MIFTELTFTVYQILGGLDGKESACSVGDLGSISGLGRFPGERNGNPLQYSCLGNPMDKGAWWGFSPRGCKESDMTYRLNHNTSSKLIHVVADVRIPFLTEAEFPLTASPIGACVRVCQVTSVLSDSWQPLWTVDRQAPLSV